MRTNKVKFCKMIQYIRKEEHLTLQELSKRSGLSAPLISRVEHGTFPTKITTINKLQNGLSLTDERMVKLLGFQSREYRDVPIISAKVDNLGKALANAKTLSFIASYTPKHSFIVKVGSEMAPSIRKNSYVLVDRNFDYANGKIYAIKLDNRILIGRVYKSKGQSYGVLVTNKNSYFNVDYRGRYTILGKVVRIIDMLE